MTFIHIINACSIPAETSHESSSILGKHWIIHNFTYDKDTICMSVDKQITCESALLLIKQGLSEGRAINPRLICSSKFMNSKEIAFTGFAICGMAFTFGLMSILGSE